MRNPFLLELLKEEAKKKDKYLSQESLYFRVERQLLSSATLEAMKKILESYMSPKFIREKIEIKEK